MYNEFVELLKVAQYNPYRDQLILLGDYEDRGVQSHNVIQLVYELVHKDGAIALKGNHDIMFIEWLDTGDYGLFLQNGGMSTLMSYCGYGWDLNGATLEQMRQHILSNYSHHVELLRNLPLYHETDEHIFVHAGLNPFYEDWRNTSPKDMVWIREMFINSPTQTDKTVVFGHTPVINMHGKHDVWFGGDKVGIDGACAYGGQLNCLDICDDGYRVHSVVSGVKVHT